MGQTAMIRPKIFRDGQRVDTFPLLKPLDQNQRPIGELALNQKHLGEISVRYSTVFGHDIEDTFSYEGRADNLVYQPARRRLILAEDDPGESEGGQ